MFHQTLVTLTSNLTLTPVQPRVAIWARGQLYMVCAGPNLGQIRASVSFWMSVIGTLVLDLAVFFFGVFGQGSSATGHTFYGVFGQEVSITGHAFYGVFGKGVSITGQSCDGVFGFCKRKNG